MRDHRLACETIASRRVPSSSRDGLSRIRAIYISGQNFETYIARMRDGFSLQCSWASFLASRIIIKKSRLEYIFSITLTWPMCVHLSVFHRTVLFLFFQFSLLFFIKIKYFFWIRVSCHLLNDISKNCNFYRVPLTRKFKLPKYYFQMLKKYK